MSKTDKNDIIPKITCKRCRYTWILRVQKPVRCPNCNTRFYDKEKEK